jgi:hypothetical protein
MTVDMTTPREGLINVCRRSTRRPLCSRPMRLSRPRTWRKGPNIGPLWAGQMMLRNHGERVRTQFFEAISPARNAASKHALMGLFTPVAEPV